MINNKLIAQNTILLYIRMFFLMCISLYTSRIILHTLGVSDYGIYNVVGGVIVLFSFINNALTSTTRRFLNYQIGKGDDLQLRSIFASLLSVNLIVSFIILFLGETIGLWFVNYQLNIPVERMYAANVVYQISVLTTFCGIILSPYEGAIIAEERMSIYAGISLFEALFKLGLVFSLLYTPFDRLISYSIYIALISLFFWIYKVRFCYKNFKYCQYLLSTDKVQYAPLLNFSGWSLFGQIAYIGSTTGVNMIVNMFLGVTVNAAIGIAQQINATIYNFVSNFQTAFNPQLVQTLAAGNKIEHAELLSRTTRISYYLLLIIALPVVFNIDFILHLWLIEVPKYTSSFAIIVIAFSLVEAVGAPLWMSMQAIGNIRNYQVIISSINILNIPLAFVILSNGFSPTYVLCGQFFIGIILFLFRFFYVLPKLDINQAEFFRINILPIIFISLVTFVSVYTMSKVIEHSLLRFVVITLMSLLLCVTLVYLIGITSDERHIVKTILLKYIRL